MTNRHKELPLREKQILGYLCEGLTYIEMAKRLNLGLGTIKINVRFLLLRLNATTVPQAVAIAFRKGLIT